MRKVFGLQPILAEKIITSWLNLAFFDPGGQQGATAEGSQDRIPGDVPETRLPGRS